MWKKIKVPGPTCYINEEGLIKQSVMIVNGHVYTNVIRKPILLKTGAALMAFREDGRQTNKYVHALVAEKFVPNPHKHPYIHFIDGDASNCRAENLMWSPIRSARCRLSEADVKQIRILIADKTPHRVIAKQFGVCFTLITAIASGRAWRHVR